MKTIKRLSDKKLMKLELRLVVRGANYPTAVRARLVYRCFQERLRRLGL